MLGDSGSKDSLAFISGSYSVLGSDFTAVKQGITDFWSFAAGFEFVDYKDWFVARAFVAGPKSSNDKEGILADSKSANDKEGIVAGADCVCQSFGLNHYLE